MKKKLALLGIHLTVVALVLILTMVTLAWYTKNETVDTSQVVITAEGLDQLGAVDHPDNIINYKGETGLGNIGDPDAPYIATKVISIAQESKYSDDQVLCYLSNIYVKMPNDTIINDQTEGFSNIYDAFTCRVKVVKPETDEDGKVTYTTLGVFSPNEEGMLMDEDGNPLTFQDENYFELSDYDLSENSYICSTMINIELIFLDEEGYSKSASERTTPFLFSSYDYMGAVFYATFTLGLEQGSIPTIYNPLS